MPNGNKNLSLQSDASQNDEGHNLRNKNKKNYNETSSSDEDWSTPPKEGNRETSLTNKGIVEMTAKTASENDTLVPESLPPIWFNNAMANIGNQFSQLREEVADMKKQLFEEQEKRFLQFEGQYTTRIAEQDSRIEQQNEQIQKLNENVAEQEAKIAQQIGLMQKLNENVAAPQDCIGSQEKKEAERLSNNLILSGNFIPAYSERENTTEISTDILRNTFKLNVKDFHIASTNRLGKPPPQGVQDRRNIIIRLTNKSIKNDIIVCNIKNRVRGLYINEELTGTVNEIYYKLRKLKKENPDEIATLYTRDGVIIAREEKRGKLFSIFTENDLIKFKQEVGLP